MFRGAALEKYPRRAAIVILGSSAGGSDHASTTFTVNSASDFADVNIGDGVCDAANLRNIIGEPVIIDGFTQPGASSNALTKGTNAKLMIELNGSGVTGTFESTGLRISAPNSTVQGLTINRFTSGVSVFAERVSVSQNLIGTDPSGTLDRGNSGSGIFVQGFDNVIGGASSQDANLISGNDGAGISIRSQASQTAVSHNLIGSDKSGTRGSETPRRGWR